jgi:mannose-6-phosphate isomerase-like protein (cupin superfamily)
MNSNKVRKELKEKYPNCTIFENKIDGEVVEILCEVDPSTEHEEYSLAIAIIDKSLPHFHKESVEIYKIIKGELTLYIDGESINLKEGESYTIKTNKIHWAEGNETWIECYSEPGWKFEDHILV